MFSRGSPRPRWLSNLVQYKLKQEVWLCSLLFYDFRAKEGRSLKHHFMGKSHDGIKNPDLLNR